MPDFDGMLEDPRMRQMVQQRSQGRPGGPGNMQQRSKQPSNPLAALANAYPKMKEQSDKMAIQDAERKAKKMKFDMMFKKAEQAFKLKQQQEAMQKGQQQIEAGRNSV